jgi:hypothetical protein
MKRVTIQIRNIKRVRNIKKHKKQKYKELIKKDTKSYNGINFEKLRAERLLREQSELEAKFYWPK